MQPLVSVILPVYRAPKTIWRAIKSILRQTLENLELIIVQNDSDQETQNIIQQFSDSRIKQIILPQADVALAFNKGLKAAKGIFIARMDSDDISLKKRLEIQAKHLSENPNVDIISSRVRFKSSIQKSAGFATYVDWQNSLMDHSSIFNNRFVESPLVNPSCMVRKSVLLKADGYRTGNFPEDYELWLRLLDSNYNAHKTNETLLIWQDHQERLTRNDSRYDEAAFHKIKTKYLVKDLQSKGIIRNINHIPSQSNSSDFDDSLFTGNRPLIIWGAGKIAKTFTPLIEDAGFHIHAYLDIDPRKIGQILKKKPVIHPEQLKMYINPFILSYVPGWKARREIYKYLEQQGMKINKDFYAMA